MEIDSNNVSEIEKYAFLLGSAIKNEDTNQFFSIYDSILPKDLPDNQLDDIKDRARKVADLSDGEFNNLVLRARHFSLAPAGTAMTCRRESPSKRWTQPGKDEDSDEDDGIATLSYTHHGGKSDTSSLYLTTKTSTRSSESDTKKFDDDSGVCNSSKATNSIGSLSDQDGSEDEGRGVSFDYYPPQIKIRSGCGLNLDYDEAHDVKSDRSSQDVNSPRSDISEGIEMTTFHNRIPADDDDDEFKFRRDTVSYQDDFNTSGESEDETYRHKYYNMGYRPLTKDTPNYQPKFESRHSWDSDLTSSSLRSSKEVDRGINFTSLKDGTSQYSRHSSHQYPQSRSSDRVKIEKNSYKREKTDPPFGRGPEQFDKVASSINSLISGVTSDEVKNMPEGRKLEPLQREDPKRRKKKKKSAKDDTCAATDENGNPILENRGLNQVQYKQMRESPSSGGGTVANQQHYEPSYGTFPTIEQFGPRSYTTSSRESNNDTASKAWRRRQKRQEKHEPDKKAEDIENYKGDKSIDELMSFISGQNDSNKKAKKNSAVVEDIPSKTQKSNKKNKDKQKSPIAPSSAKIKQFIQNLTTTVQRLSINYQQPGIPALCTSPGAVPQSRKSPESILADIFEPILYAVPRNRKTYEKSLTRRMSLPEMANARPKKNIIICLDCGNPHERQTICGHCYSKVRDETGRMMEAMGEDKFNFDHPRQEVAYLYKGENAEDIPMYKGKYLVEMDTERPSWFTQDLLKKVKGDT